MRLKGFLQHLRFSLRLYFRNRMALTYGYLFPLLFLLAFHVLYRHDEIPLLRHFGELLTLGALGGACFGLPAILVGERERGVWRRYRLAPIPLWVLVAGTVTARYILLLSAGVLQLAAAAALGMTPPAHPFDLWVAFSLVAFAFIGLGLVIAMLADTVPAAQALAQCVFLPMLIVGGVAVPLTALPLWVQRLAGFFPGRYAVDALQSATTGKGIGETSFSLFALALIGSASFVASIQLFRWDVQQRFPVRRGVAGLGTAVAACVAVGLIAEPPAANLPQSSEESLSAAIAAGSAASISPPRWQEITAHHVVALNYNLPPDAGIITPFAKSLATAGSEAVQNLRRSLATWPPGLDRDPVQSVRNFLGVAAIADVNQLPFERELPVVVLDVLRERYSRDQLIRICAWIALHPREGTTIEDLSTLGVDAASADPAIVQERAMIYALKMIQRLVRGENAEARPEKSADPD